MARHHKPRHLTIALSKLSRAKKKSFTSGVAYIRRLRLYDERLGITHNHIRKGGVLAKGMFGWLGDLDSLRRTASNAERRSNAVEGRELILAFPSELPVEACLLLLEQLARWLFERHQVASVYAVHAPDKDGDSRNRHGHLLFTSRRVGDDGASLAEKSREWDTASGRKLTENLRAYWCESLNLALEARGAEPDIEHRSFARLRMNRTAGKHRGVAKTAWMRRRAEFETEVQHEGAVAVISPVSMPSLTLPPGPHQEQPVAQTYKAAPAGASLVSPLEVGPPDSGLQSGLPTVPARPVRIIRPVPIPETQPEPSPGGAHR